MSNNKNKKKVDLDKLIEDLEPEKINEEVAMPHRDIRNKYKIDNIKATDWDDFRKQIIKYVKHHHKKIYKTDMPDEIAYSQARTILDQMTDPETGRKLGFIGAYEMARKGKLPKIIDFLADAFEAQHVDAYDTHVWEQVDPLDFDQHEDLVKQYREKYEKFLPKKFKDKSDKELARNYKGLVMHHKNVVEMVKQNMKKYNPKIKKYEPKYEEK